MKTSGGVLYMTPGTFTNSGGATLPNFFLSLSGGPGDLHSFPTRRSSDLGTTNLGGTFGTSFFGTGYSRAAGSIRSVEHTPELQSLRQLVCCLVLVDAGGLSSSQSGTIKNGTIKSNDTTALTGYTTLDTIT